jgi:hypothetical protein
MGKDKVPAQQSGVTPAPIQTINVYFLQYNLLAGTAPVFVFLYNPTILTLPNTGGAAGTSYQVTFNLVSNIPGATLSTENTVSGAPPSGIAPSGQGTTQLTILFTNVGITGTVNTSFNYTLTVTANGTTYTSDDPELEIPPPNG